MSWAGTTIVVILSYQIGKRLVGADEKFMVLMSGSVSICGASAATGINDSFGESMPPSVLTAVIAILTLFTVPQMFALPFFADRGVHLASNLSGAWIGATIDSTGFVIASASLLGKGDSGENVGVDTAATVKIIQNVLIAPVCVVIASYFPAVTAGTTSSGRNPMFSGPDLPPAESNTDDAITQTKEAMHPRSVGERLGGTAALLWKRLPKFAIGFVLASGVLSVMIELSEDRAHETYLVIQSFSRLCFAIGFFHIGLSTNIPELWRKLGSMASAGGGNKK